MIYYLVADHPEPSWGTGMLYEHVRLLRAAGHDARVLHHNAPYRPTWRSLDVPVDYVRREGFVAHADDMVVVPEVLAASPEVPRFPWRRIVFVQGGLLIARGLDGRPDYPALGYEAAMAVLPFVAHVVERHFGLPAKVVPPFVAPHFLTPSRAPRRRRILLAVKEGYRLAGVPDEPIASLLLEREMARRPGWSVERLVGRSHVEVAELMKTSEFLVNVNSMESFNTTVPEAMAAGCIAVCYDAVGGRDFLRPGENALVFSNHDVYSLVEKVCELVDRFDDQVELRARLRAGAAATAARYSPAATAEALGEFFAHLLQSPVA